MLDDRGCVYQRPAQFTTKTLGIARHPLLDHKKVVLNR